MCMLGEVLQILSSLPLLLLVVESRKSISTNKLMAEIRLFMPLIMDNERSLNI